MRHPRRWRTACAFGLLLLLGAGMASAARPEIVGAQFGLGGKFKLGCWAPLRVSVAAGDEPLAVDVMAIAPDSDGVGVATMGRPLSTEPGTTSEQVIYARTGQQYSPVHVRLLAGGRVVDRRSFPVDLGGFDEDAIGEPVKSVQKLYLQLSPPSDQERAAMLVDLELLEGGAADVYSALVQDASQLPRDAIGYDSFDAVLLVTGSGPGASEGGWLRDLGPSDARIQALVRWVESGGRLVLSCGAAGEALLGPGGPLEAFVPGSYAGPDSLASPEAIHSYTDPPEDVAAISLGGSSLRVSEIDGVRGIVEAFAGRKRTDKPLVVRTPRGFGEVTFVAFDLDAPSLEGWQGRSTLLRRLLSQPINDPQADSGWQWRVYSEDFVSQLVEQLDESFSGVRSAPFLLIVGLVVLYLLLIGPGDYFFVKNVLKRVEATWITFPILVIATSAAAYAGAYWLKGDRLRVNQVELIDIECESGRTQGALVTHLFSPRADRYDLGLAPRTIAGEPLGVEERSTAWLGKPGWGLGGMQSGSGASRGVPNYQINPTPLLAGGGATTSVFGLPIQVWSTKTLVSRYAGRTNRLIDSSLSPNQDELVEGAITNDTGSKLLDCRLLYGAWTWRLGSLSDGETTTVDTSVQPIKITTLLTRLQSQSGADAIDAMTTSASVAKRARGTTVARSRYLGYLDLTHRLDAGDALLLARVSGGPRSELVTAEGDSLIDAESDDPAEPSQKSWVYARFVLPVGEE